MKNSELVSYLSNARAVLARFESRVGWNKPDINGVEYVPCPNNQAHRMPQNRLDTHLKLCKWRNLGYSDEEIHEIVEQEEKRKARNDPTVIDTDEIISHIAPGTHPLRTDEQYKSTLNPGQRLAVYEASVTELYKSERQMPDKALYADLEAKAAEELYQKENPENLSEVQLLQRMRDMKRRRQSYRAKNVHITKRTQTEIIRGVLEVHMEALRKLWNPKSYKKDKEKDSGSGRRVELKRKRERSSERYDSKRDCREKRRSRDSNKDAAHYSKDWDRRRSSDKTSRKSPRNDKDENENVISKSSIRDNNKNTEQTAVAVTSTSKNAESGSSLDDLMVKISEVRKEISLEPSGSKEFLPPPVTTKEIRKSRYSLSDEVQKHFSSRAEEAVYFGYQVNQSISFYKSKLSDNKQWQRVKKFTACEKVPEEEDEGKKQEMSPDEQKSEKHHHKKRKKEKHEKKKKSKKSKNKSKY